MIWTDEKINEMMRLLSEGHSISQVARQFGVSKNTISGKSWRERVKRGEVVEKPRVRDRRKVANDGTVQKRQYTRREAMLSLPERAGSVSAYVTPKIPAPDLGQLASIVDVTGCKWPVRDDPSFIGGQAFCNHEKRDDKGPYCPFHAAAARSVDSDMLIRRIGAQVEYILRRAAA